MKLFFFTDAAKKISKELTRAGAKIIAKPRDFYIKKLRDLCGTAKWKKQLFGLLKLRTAPRKNGILA